MDIKLAGDSAEFYRNIAAHRRVSIIGLEKNTGKTTTLDFLLRLFKDVRLGMTSAGRDGETKDMVTHTRKPRIFVGRGCIFATAKDCLLASDVTFEILETTPVETPLGGVIAARALSSGFVELAGPSTASGLRHVCAVMRKHGVEKILIDGALSRKSLACPAVSGAAVLCTGGAVALKPEELSKITANALEQLSIPGVNEKTLRLYTEVTAEEKLAFVYEDRVEKSGSVTVLGAGKKAAERMSSPPAAIFIKGAVTDGFMKSLLDVRADLSRTVFVAEDGTRLLLSEGVYRAALSRGARFFAANPVNVLGISVNPTSPDGGKLDFAGFRKKMKGYTALPVIDVMNSGFEVIE